ncbi:interferon-induced helicase C domain-containing protein 1 [Spea bombifrons]|uniref:interferon-induced helicase C domain-containing protein 1 n=1 Tax=Spea bombifrons TaxID=233779 RepID=UPI00234BB1D9|nr:interferon-induced helicase C domain-containing protein 1 [Spea bombifrons]
MTEDSNEEVNLYMIRVFRTRLIRTIQVIPVLDHLTFLDIEIKSRVKTVAENQGNPEAARLLLDLIENGRRALGWFEEFVRALKETECTQAALYLVPEELPTPSLEAKNDECEQLIQILCPELVRGMLPDETCLKCHQKEICSDEDMDVIKAIRTQRGDIAASRELLNRITKKKNWFSIFVEVLRELDCNELANNLTGGESIESIVESSGTVHRSPEDKDSKESKVEEENLVLDAVTINHENQDEGSQNSELETSYAESSSELDSSAMELSVDRSFENGDTTTESDDDMPSDRSSLVPEITLRGYQMEVAKPALEGKNIIICLPTGSGKTRVAVYITQQHLEKRSNQGLLAKVIVLVNKVPLVEQHFQKEFEPHLKNRYRVIKISGDSSLKISLKHVVNENDVIICTAKILENSLIQAKEDKEEGVKLSDFSLIIIDECHHTQKGDVYNNIMIRYIKQKKRNIMKKKTGLPQVELPQILGLTASPGVGAANNNKKAEEHILRICANLDAHNIMTVQEHATQLQNQVKEPCKRIEIAEDKKKNPFGDRLKAIMEEIQSYGTLSTTSAFGTQSYEQWIVQKERTAAKEENRKEHVCAEHLRKYNDALGINDTIRMTDALNHLKKFYAEEKKKKLILSEENGNGLIENIDETDKFLIDLFDKHKKELKTLAGRQDYENEKLISLRKSIMEEFTRNSKARGIIFTKTRQSAVSLYEWIKGNEKFEEVGIRPQYLIGAGHNSDFKPMTQNEQKKVIHKFSTGEVNLLIATSVAEEGLDIKECNIVIQYGLVTNEISMLQARGRARADDSSYVLVGSSSSLVAEHDSVNQIRERMMHKAIKKVQDMDRSLYLDKIQEFQSQNIVEKSVKNIKATRKKCQGNPSMVTFQCKGCFKPVCCGSDIRVIENMHHVNTEENFKALFSKIEKGGNFAEYQTNGDIICKDCGKTWGPMMVYKGLDVPCLRITNFLVKVKDQKLSLDKNLNRWSDLPIAFPAFKYAEPEFSSDEDDD